MISFRCESTLLVHLVSFSLFCYDFPRFFILWHFLSIYLIRFANHLIYVFMLFIFFFLFFAELSFLIKEGWAF